MTLYLTSDLHLGHRNIVEKGWRSFSSVEEMNKTLIENWNSVVLPTDQVLVIGDFAMGQLAETLPLANRLNGWLLLCPGNHDRCSSAYEHKTITQRARWTAEYQNYFTIMPEQFHMKAGGMHFDVCHFPRSGDHTEEIRYADKRPPESKYWLLHGHMHSSTPWSEELQYEVGVDSHNFTPVSIDQIVEEIKEREGMGE